MLTQYLRVRASFEPGVYIVGDGTISEEPLMIWGGGLGQKRDKKKLNCYSCGKKTQLNNLE